MSLFELAFYFHSFNRYLLLVFLGLVIINSLTKFIRHKNFNRTDNIFSVVLMISSHIQLLVGIYLYIESPLVVFRSNVMKIPTLRYWTAEHISMMLLAIVVITLGRILSKKSLRKGKSYKPHLILFLSNSIALTIISISLLAMLRISL